jgi:hypothetical protein
MSDILSSPLVESILPSFKPCAHLAGVCSHMRWSPADGHVPRGFCGAIGKVREVELVLVSAEPGDPLPGEAHTGIESVITFAMDVLRNPPTRYHQNVRQILEYCFPGQSFDEQLRRTWRTNSVLCSAEIEGGRVPRSIERTCINTYLARQLALLPDAFVAALGNKAQNRLRRQGIGFFPAAHPSSRKSEEEKHASWQALAKQLLLHRLNLREHT